MQQTAPKTPATVFVEQLPPIRLRAFTFDDRAQLLRYLPAAFSASGAWILRHDAAAGMMRFFFEFERSNGMNVYMMLVALGLELTGSSHLALTCFCQRSLYLTEAQLLQVATCELEVREILEESGEDPLFGRASST